MPYWIVKDDYDQTTVCIVRCDTSTQARRGAQDYFGDISEGDLYAYTAPFIDLENEEVKSE